MTSDESASLDGRPSQRLVAILFTDIVDSTSLTAEVGDEVALKAIDAHFVILNQELAGHRGTAIDAVGDSMLASFASPADAVRCAMAMHAAIEQAQLRFGLWHLRIRAGIHYGSSLVLQGRLFGDLINIGSRIVSAAGRQEIACTRDVWERLPEDLASAFEYLAPMLPRGSRKVKQLYGWIAPFKHVSLLTETEYDGIRDFSKWTPRDSYTVLVTDPDGNEHRLRLTGDGPEIFVGRGGNVDLHIPSRSVSRRHLCFCVVHRHLWVFDLESSHGIFVRHPDNAQKEVQVQHQARLTIGSTGRFADAQFICLED